MTEDTSRHPKGSILVVDDELIVLESLSEWFREDGYHVDAARNAREALDKVASHYEEAVDNAVDSLSSLMEPLIMSILGVLVGGLMIAMYLPIFMLGSVI